jgi:hypothetical protein
MQIADVAEQICSPTGDAPEAGRSGSQKDLHELKGVRASTLNSGKSLLRSPFSIFQGPQAGSKRFKRNTGTSTGPRR